MLKGFGTIWSRVRGCKNGRVAFFLGGWCHTYASKQNWDTGSQVGSEDGSICDEMGDALRRGSSNVAVAGITDGALLQNEHVGAASKVGVMVV